MMNFSMFYGLCDSIKKDFKVFMYLGIWFLFSSLVRSRQTTGKTDEEDYSVFAFCIIHIDEIILCFYYMCFESINLIFLIECCKIAMH